MIAIVALVLSTIPLQEPVFDCRGPGRRTTVTIEHGLVVYRHRSRGRGDIAIPATAGSQDVRQARNLFAAALSQIRFLGAGGWSYTVYSMPRNSRTGSHAVSGVMVRRGTATIADLGCRPWSDIDMSLLPQGVVEDDPDWNSM
jgi:hypothetical protein